MNSRRMNRLEELGRVDAEKAKTRMGARNLKDEKKRIVRELKADGGKVKKRKKAGPKAGRPAAPSDQRRMGKGAQGSRKKEDSSKTLGKFMKAKIDSIESTVKKGGIGADRVLSKYRNPERAEKFIKSGGFRKNAKDAAYYKSIGLTGKRGEQAAKDFFKPESKKMPVNKLVVISKKDGGRALKPVQPNQKGLKKLPTKVRNKMGYMKKGGRVGMGKAMRGGGCVR